MSVCSQAEAGVGCPISMTYSVIPALRKQPEIAAEWEPRFLSLSYDGENLRPAADKAGALCGMGMTEKQGGSDVRSNTTVAKPLNGGGPGAEYALTGHKWFFSAPMCDAFLVLAQAEGGVSCFFMPRFTPDGERNPIHIQRLKDKLGNRRTHPRRLSSVVPGRASSARRGVACRRSSRWSTTRASTARSAPRTRCAPASRTRSTTPRSAPRSARFLIEQPLMQNVLADLAVESEAATIGALRLARAYDAGHRR